MTWTWNHVPDNETLLTIEFRDNNGATALTLTHQKHVSSESRDHHQSGWSGSLDKLEKYVVNATSAA
jgi:uncharacterized protein YndB with AHSA1/START domain